MATINSGLIPSPPDERDFPVSAIAPAVTLPRSVRLDDKILSIRNQGFFPTCVGKSGAGIMSAGFGIPLATIPIYKICKLLDGIPHLPGTYPRTAMDVMLKYGTCRDQTMPYSLISEPMPPLTAAVERESEGYRITAYARARGITDIKQALTNGHLLMGCLLVADNFVLHKGAEVIGAPNGYEHGYHAVIICGYDDDKKALRIANSWGNWGDEGYGWLGYDVLMNVRHWPEAWVVEIRRDNFYPDRIFRLLKKKLIGGVKMIYEKAFWVALIGVLVPLVNHFFDLGLQVGEIVAIALPIIALILGVTWKETEIEKAEIQLDIALVNAGVYEVDE